MNGLSLRVSSIANCNSIKRNYECKQEKVEIKFKCDFKEKDVLDFIQTFSQAASVDNQLQLLKTLSYESSSSDEFLQLFCEVYIKSPAKHSIRNNLSKLIDKIGYKNHDKLPVITMSNALEELLSTMTKDSSEKYLNDSIMSVGGLIENFSVGKQAFETQLGQICLKIDSCLNQFLFTLSKESNSPAFRNEICQYIHNSLRVLIAATQHFNENINWNQLFHSVIQKCWIIIEDPRIPIDTKTNAGILIITDAKATGKIEKVLETSLDDYLKNLCLSFGVLCISCNTEAMLDKVTERMNAILIMNSLEPCIILCVCRVMVQYSKTLKHIHNENSVIFGLNYALNNLDHYMDSIRHMSIDILKNVVEISSIQTLDKLLMYLKSPSFSATNKGIIVTSMCQIKGAQFVFQHIPNVCLLLMEWLEDSTAHNTNSTLSLCYENLFTDCIKNYLQEKWFETFLVPLIEFLKLTNNMPEIKKTIESLILKAVKKKPEIISLIQKYSVPMSLLLNCFVMAKKCGVFDGIVSNEAQWKEILEFDTIKQSMISSDDETRMAALALIVETHKITEMLTNIELQALLYFMKHNIENSQSPAIRQKIQGYSRNLFNRLNCNISYFRKFPETPCIQNYKDFIHQLSTFCFNNFFPGANFGRRSLSLHFLIQITDLLDNNKHFNIQIWNENNHKVMINCLNDSYESNKAAALNILKSCPKTHFTQDNSITLEYVKTLANSPKPAESLCAAYYLEYIVCIWGGSDADKIILDSFNTGDVKLNALKWIFNLVNEGIQIAKQSIADAASSCPLYGLLFCVRHILNKVNFSKLPVDEWRPYFIDLIQQCKILTDVVGPVVNDSSPEGHLPSDFETKDDKNISSQMILLCAWRTVKEVSLILGDLSLKANTKLISADQLLGIGSHFTTILSETKHRGAFEQAFVSFSRYCVRFWSAEEPELHQLPMKWIQVLVKVISGDSDACEPTLDMNINKLCATRRSAGVPFLIQALITTELQIGSTKSLKFCMESFFEICKSGSNDAKTHALNILRALFRCSDLGEAIGDYVSDGFITAINGYDAESWSERNSSTLLFSALMVRVFGVQRSRDMENLNVRNKMTGRIFFLRYPKLYDFFLIELVEASKLSQKGIRCRKLHSILLLLNRLYPSSLEGVESNLQLTKFIPYISLCGASPEFKTRCIVARVIPIFLPPDDVIPRINKILNIILNSENSTLNSLHGALLQIKYLIKSLTINKKNDSDLQTMMEKLLTLELPKVPIIWIEFYDIILEMFVKFSVINFEINISKILEFDTENECPGWNVLAKKTVCIKFLKVLQSPSRSILDKFILNLDCSQIDYESQDTIMNILLLIANFDKIVEDADELEISDSEIQIVRKFLEVNFKNLDIIRKHIQNNRELFVFLHPLLKHNYYDLCSIKAFTLVSYSKKMTESFVNACGGNYQFLIETAESKTSHLRTAIYRCFSTYLTSSKVQFKSLQGLVIASHPDNSLQLRLIAAEMVSQKRLFLEVLSQGKKNIALIYNFFWSILTLLGDEIPSIRNVVSKSVVKMYNTYLKCTENENVLPSVSRQYLFKLLREYLLINFNDNMDKVALVYVEILMLDKMNLEKIEQCSSTSDETLRCFDKSDGSVFHENIFTKMECFARIQEISQFESISSDLRSMIETIKEDMDNVPTNLTFY